MFIVDHRHPFIVLFGLMRLTAKNTHQFSPELHERTLYSRLIKHVPGGLGSQDTGQRASIRADDDQLLPATSASPKQRPLNGVVTGLSHSRPISVESARRPFTERPGRGTEGDLAPLADRGTLADLWRY